jgi:hypothetical protein
MGNLIGSPLGLTNLTSTGNVLSNAYNKGLKQPTDITDDKNINIQERISLFTGGSVHKFWSNIGKIGTDKDTTGLIQEKWDNDYNGIDRSELHNDSVYDTSITNIIDKLELCPRARLKPLDFAYLKDLGVYPNNRLVIARRFLNPVKDNIMDRKGTPPIAVLITWKKETEEFLDFKFGEEWEIEQDASFTNILNGIGNDVLGKKMGSKLGGYLGAGGNIVGSLPGFTEVAQRRFFEKIGILKDGASNDILPSGNPNIIKEARRRKLLDPDKQGSGLTCKISIKMNIKYEQKFISGIDPTIAWMNILSNALSFGTSNSANYGLSEKFRDKLDVWSTNPWQLVKDIVDTLTEQFGNIMEEVKNLTNDPSKLIEELKAGAIDLTSNTLKLIEKSIPMLVRKYKIKIMSVASVLSGAPSTPWHVTIGNPLRPLFCSGDMYIDGDVSIKLGPTLAFNDLPSNIEIDLTLQNARNLGMQEIMAKFNTGYLRVSNVRKSFLEYEDMKEVNLVTDIKSTAYTLPLMSEQERAKQESDNYYASEADKAINKETRNAEGAQNITSNNSLQVNRTSKESDFGQVVARSLNSTTLIRPLNLPSIPTFPQT